MLITKCAPSAPTADFVTLQTRCALESSCLWLLRVVCGPAHGPRADVKEPAAGAWPPILVAFPQRKEIFLAASQLRRNGAERVIR